MKYISIALLLTLMFPVSADDDPPQAGDEVVIAVQNQSIYPMPAFYASPTQPVSYGAVATVLEVNGDWLKVSTSGGSTGWIHVTAVTGALQGGGQTTASGQVTTDEVMLAGRGFSQEIEDSYAGEHPELDFTLVDQLENAHEITAEELFDFLVQGNLIDGEVSH